MANRVELMQAIAEGQTFKRASGSLEGDPVFEALLVALRELEEEGFIEIPRGRVSRDSMHAAGGIRAVAPKITAVGRAWLDEQE